jgi:Fur family zinc uptake transcriptional regulator
LNAYVGCPHPEQTHSGQFLICRNCGSIGELDDPEIADSVRERAARQGFQAERQTIEVRGLCGDCARLAPDALRVVQ